MISDQVSTALLSSMPDLSAAAAPKSSSASRDTPEAVAKAASQFEALLIGEVLKSAKEGDGSDWLGTDGDEAGSTLTDLSEQQVSQALASSGGLGLAKMITAGLSKAASKLANPPSLAPR